MLLVSEADGPVPTFLDQTVMALVNPLATVISSGDNESYAHPRADARDHAARLARRARAPQRERPTRGSARHSQPASRGKLN